MRKTFIVAALIGTFALTGAGVLLAQQNAEEAKFAKTLETFMDEYWKFYPTAATLAGFYKYNAKLEDFGESAVEKRGNALDAANKELVTKIALDKLGPEAQIDRQLLLDAIDYELFRLESLVPQEYNPLYYNEIFLQSLRGILVKDFAALDARLKDATERAKLLPALIKSAKENFKTPAKEYTEAAIKQFPAILAFYKTEVPGLIEKGGAEAKAKFLAEHAKVVAALEDYGKFLSDGLLPKSTGNFRLGPEAHQRLLRLTTQGSIMVDELVNRTKADYNNIRREMFLVCTPFYRIMYPEVNLEELTTKQGAEQVRNTIIKGVLDKIKGDHVTKDGWLDKIKASTEEIKTFTASSKILDLPADSFIIEPMPNFAQGPVWLKLITPAPYENGGAFILQVQPIPADWPEDKVQGFLEEFNNYAIYFWTIERVFPGQFLPAALTLKSASVLRKLHPSLPLLAGWPLYTEEMFINAGFGEYDLRLRLNQLKLQLKAVIDFQMELNVHEGNYTKEQVVSYMTRGGFMTQAEAERKWDMLVLSPGSSIYPYLGYQEILDMEKDYKQAKGASFSQKEFAQKLLSFGPLPIRLIKTKIVQ